MTIIIICLFNLAIVSALLCVGFEEKYIYPETHIFGIGFLICFFGAIIIGLLTHDKAIKNGDYK